MIHYTKGMFRCSTICRLSGSPIYPVIPPALICGALGFFFKLLELRLPEVEHRMLEIISSGTVYSAASVLIAFLITFRTQSCYNRYWHGAEHLKHMQAEFFVTASNLIAFSRPSKCSAEQVSEFQNILVRLVSLLHAVCLSRLGGEEMNMSNHLVDAKGLDILSLHTLWTQEPKVELLLQWIQSLTVDAHTAGVVPIAPPILSRVFQNLGNGMTAFYMASRLVEVPYPFPLVQTTDVLLICHLLTTPIVMCNLTHEPVWSGFFSFIIALMFLSVNVIARELEDPYNNKINSLNLLEMQGDINKRLKMLVRAPTKIVPKLSAEAKAIDGRSETSTVVRGGPGSGTMFIADLVHQVENTSSDEVSHPSPLSQATSLRSMSDATGSRCRLEIADVSRPNKECEVRFDTKIDFNWQRPEKDTSAAGFGSGRCVVKTSTAEITREMTESGVLNSALGQPPTRASQAGLGPGRYMVNSSTADIEREMPENGLPHTTPMSPSGSAPRVRNSMSSIFSFSDPRTMFSCISAGQPSQS